MNQFIRASIFALVLAAPIASQAGKSTPLLDHAHVGFTELSDRTPTPGKVREAIAAVGLSHGWRVVDEKPGEMTLRNDIREQFQVVVKVSYDASGMQVDYVSSENLNYTTRHGIPYIHHKYNQWVALLMRDVANKLSY